MKVPPIYPHLLAELDRFYDGRAEVRSAEPAQGPRTRSSRAGKELRILLTTFWKYPVAGGLTSYLRALKSGFEKHGHRVDIIHPEGLSAERMPKVKRRLKGEIERVLKERYGRANAHIVSTLQSMLAYEALLGERDLGKYDVLHAQDRFTANALGRLNRAHGKPLFFTPHGFMTQKRVRHNLIPKDSDEAAFFWAIDRNAVEVSDKSIILSETFRPLLMSLGAADSKLETIHTGIEFAVRSDKTDEKRLVISCVSRLGPRKGHKILLEALNLIRSHLDRVRVCIVGDGEMRDELERLSSKLDLRSVYFWGHRDDVENILSKSDIYVLPTISDTLPISVIEAMFAGKAIVTTRVGGIPELIRHQETGLLAEPGDVKQLADCLLRLMQDRDLAKRLGRNAQQYARDHLTADKMASKIEGVYRSVMRPG